MTTEKTTKAASGWAMLPVNFLIFAVGALAAMGLFIAENPGGLLAMLIAGLGLFMLKGHFTLQPNEGAVFSFFGPYVGTVRESGFYWINPLYSKQKISLRAAISKATR